MELIRADFPAYIAQVRQTIGSVADELTTAKARNDLQCVLHILTLMEAETCFLGKSQAAMEAQMDVVEALLAPLMNAGKLTDLHAGLERIANAGWPSASAALWARRNLFQQQFPAIAALADTGVAAAQAALQLMMANENAQFSKVHVLREEREALGVPSDSGAAETPRALAPVTAEAAQAYLRNAFPDETSLSVTKVFNLPGGRSKETTMIALDGVRTLPRDIVMRADIPGGLVPSQAIDEFPIITIAERYGVPVPTPLHCETDAGRLGRSFILLSAVQGKTEGEYFPELGTGVQDKIGVGLHLAQILARINSIPVTELAGTHIDTSVDLTTMVRDTIEATYAQARSFDSPSRLHQEMAYHWLTKNIHLADDEPCLIHCDVGLHNILIDNGRITAMLDWELATLASPAREVAKILHLIDYLMPREDFLAAYVEAGGPPSAVDPARLSFYAVMNYMVTNQRARYANHLFFSGQQRNVVLANAGFDNYYRGVTLLANALAEVM